MLFSPTPVTDTKGRIIGCLVDTPQEKTDWNRVVRDATRAIRLSSTQVDYSALPTYGHTNSPNSLRAGLDYYGFGPTSVVSV
jgi:hypothetical protein